MSPTWGIFVLWAVAVVAGMIDRAADDIWGENWWRSAVIFGFGYIAFSTIARHGVAW